MAHKIKVVRINQLSPIEFNVIQEGGKREAHIVWAGGLWVLDVFDGHEQQIDSINVGKNKAAPYWRQILAYFDI